MIMMMMDIGMYGHGHHNQHSGASFNPSESNFYGFASDAYNQQSHGSDYHQLPVSSHYASSNYNYEESSYICATSNSNEAPSSPQDLNYYHQPHHQPIQDNPIINTESGLSYTNLDYANSSGCPNTNYSNSSQQNLYPSEIYQRTQSDVLVRHHDTVNDTHQSHHFYHDTKYHPLHLDNENYPHLVLQNSSCSEYQNHIRYKDEGISSPEPELSHHRSIHNIQHLSSASQHSSSIPTYKWMQVKRNVPKPQGKRDLHNYPIKWHIFLLHDKSLNCLRRKLQN